MHGHSGPKKAGRSVAGEQWLVPFDRFVVSLWSRPRDQMREGRGARDAWLNFARAGRAAPAADFLTRDTDSAGQVRDDLAVLRGDPHQVADALEFEHK